MRTTPRSFFHLFVEPNFEDYLQEAHDVRRGMNAAVSAFQMADIFYAFYSRENRSVITQWPKPKDLIKHLCDLEPSFLTVQSVATVYKHLYAREGFYEVNSPGAVWGVQIPGEKIELESDFQDGRVDILVRRRDNSVVSLTNALRRVVNDMWPAFLPEEAA
ncbi:hypothetical protein [Mesorhizobium sp.]|uniref:hypothetical protein n=1 Tax=Mesorhizobium sp. TaxID=1871066 RepID=UPI00120C95A3|nr:hypothetical protein [Mesorhizobium sp.]TIP20150.1 MAG: hypothetical protein E5X66_05990 [Mesorhizobium sp.]TJV78013.1 MAG: hypothetical protein E5X45_26305 [Mesorhizobium sp.]